MAEFGKWIKIVPGCEMPNEGDVVLILIHDEGYPGMRADFYETDFGTYTKFTLLSPPYLVSSVPAYGGFDTTIDWNEGQDISVIAWMPGPPKTLDENVIGGFDEYGIL